MPRWRNFMYLRWPNLVHVLFRNDQREQSRADINFFDQFYWVSPSGLPKTGGKLRLNVTGKRVVSYVELNPNIFDLLSMQFIDVFGGSSRFYPRHRQDTFQSFREEVPYRLLILFTLFNPARVISCAENGINSSQTKPFEDMPQVAKETCVNKSLRLLQQNQTERRSTRISWALSQTTYPTWLIFTLSPSLQHSLPTNSILLEELILPRESGNQIPNPSASCCSSMEVAGILAITILLPSDWILMWEPLSCPMINPVVDIQRGNLGHLPTAHTYAPWRIS